MVGTKMNKTSHSARLTLLTCFWAQTKRFKSGRIYYPPEVRRGEYLGLGVFLLQYFLSRYEYYYITIE